jgi:hypothetical protein
MARNRKALELGLTVHRVAIGRARAFPLLQTGQATFTASAFPYLRLLVYFRPRSDFAHEHGTTRHRRSPAVPENKAFLLLALSDFSGLLQSVTFLADLHRVPVITTRHLITTLPPPSLLHAGMLASLAGEAVGEFLSSACTCWRNP